MLWDHWMSLLVALAPVIVASSPTTAATSKTSQLPSALQQAIPSCAQACVQAWMVQAFPAACTAQDNIECSCSHYDNSGAALGEVALSCVYSSCSSDDAKQNAASAYNICIGQKNAIMPTQTALTIVANAALRSSAALSYGAATATATKLVISGTQAVSMSLISTVSPPTTPTSLPNVAVAAPERAPKISPAQIAGLSVAAVAAFIVVIGMMALSICMRRRKQRRIFQDVGEMEKGHPPSRQSTHVSRRTPVKGGPISLASALMQLNRSKGSKPNTHIVKGQSACSCATPAKQRLGVGTSNAYSNLSLPTHQIGLAMTADLERESATTLNSYKALPDPQKRSDSQSSLTASSTQPTSTVAAKNTVLDEGAFAAHRASSVLLPTPPAPTVPPNMNRQQNARRSELFLHTPTRCERPKLARVVTAERPLHNTRGASWDSQSPCFVSCSRLTAPSSFVSKASKANSREWSSNTDLFDFYLTSYKESTPRTGVGYFIHPRNGLRPSRVRSKKLAGGASQTESQVSSSIRDSFASQTSFETADPDDSTPEDEDDDKRLSGSNSQISLRNESPISNLTYPKIPRASNQLVARSPQTFQGPPPHCRAAEQKRDGCKFLAPLAGVREEQQRLPLVRSNARPCLEHLRRGPPGSPPCMPRAHVRSISLQDGSPRPAAKFERQSRVQSGFWVPGPIVYEEDMVRPLNVRRAKEDKRWESKAGKDTRLLHVASEGPSSPTWVPNLTPTRKGEDLFISVGWTGDDAAVR